MHVSIAVQPHSVRDNIFKTSGRSSLLSETIKKFTLYIELNMCNLSEFDHHPVVIKRLSVNNNKRHNLVHSLASQQQCGTKVFSGKQDSL